MPIDNPRLRYARVGSTTGVVLEDETGDAVLRVTGGVAQAPFVDDGGAVNDVRAHGAVGNGAVLSGATDDRPAFAAADAAGGAVLVAGNRVYAIGTDLTITHAVQVEEGARIRLIAPSGVYPTVRFAGPVRAGRHHIIDNAAGGTVTFGAVDEVLPEWFGARPGVSTFDSGPAINRAIQAAKTAGSVDVGVFARGVAVSLGPGEYFTAAPLVLPRSGTGAPRNIVHLRGQGWRTTRLIGMSTFPANRGIIEWEAVTARCWYQYIGQLNISLPNVVGVKAIHHKLNDPANQGEVPTERWHGVMEDLLIEGSNQYHSSLIRLEGNVAASTFRRIHGDTALNTWTYDTILLHADHEIQGQAQHVYGDRAGLNMCIVEDLYGSIRRGGRLQAFKGRANACKMDKLYSDGTGNGATPGAPAFEFINSVGTIIGHLLTEGRNDSPQIKLLSCRGLTIQAVQFGAPDAAGGNGIELDDTHDCIIMQRVSLAGAAPFSAVGKKAVHIKSNCRRNRLLNFQINSTLANEVQIDAAVGNGNFVQTFNVETGGAVESAGYNYVGGVLGFNNLEGEIGYSFPGRFYANKGFRPGAVSALPAASASWRGTILRVEGGAGVADGIFVCEKDAGGGYGWRAL